MAKESKNANHKNGHDNANDNFANGYFAKHGAPNQGLENALEHNPFSINNGSVIDFDSGLMTINYSYDYYGYGGYMQGTYAEDGYTLSFTSQAYDYYGYHSDGNVTFGDPVYDADGDGDMEWGVDFSSTNSDSYYYWNYNTTYGWLTNDTGANFSLQSFEASYDDTPDTYGWHYDHLQFYTSSYDQAANVYSWSSAYTQDNVTWYTNETVYDATARSYTEYVSGTTTDLAEVAALFQDVESLYIYTTEDFTIDNIELTEVA